MNDKLFKLEREMFLMIYGEEELARLDNMMPTCKKIDIFRKDVIKDGEKRFSNPINAKDVEDYVTGIIDFNVTESQWSLIHKYFGEYWNDKLGIGGDIFSNEISEYIYNQISNQKVLINEKNVNTIVDLMLEKIEKDGGFLE
ncbi:MAG: hypothetical protein PHW92_12920 [Lutibacter sp.]|jgi:hypothetical protein|nr:hypothetical protein [Lutibacter sp.]